jgi:hypothetical protein
VPSSDASAVFLRDGDAFLPTRLANGPWAEGALHGGPTAALLAHACTSMESSSGEPLRLARLTVDLLRPVPRAALRVEARIARPGRKVDWVDAVIRAGDVEVARGSALRVRRQPVVAPPGADAASRGAAGDPTFDGGPEDGEPPVPLRKVEGFHSLGLDLRFVRSNLDRTGPGQMWVRLRQPMIEGEPITPLMRAMAAADFPNAVSKVLPFEGFSFINPDLVVALWRDPVGEWVGLDAVTRADLDQGVGSAEAVLCDRDGPFGRAQQTVLLDQLPG